MPNAIDASRRERPRMLRSAVESLARYEKAFGPYRFHELRIAEVPSCWPFGRFAALGMVVLPESRSFMTEGAPPRKCRSSSNSEF